MTISISVHHIQSSSPGSLECPIFRALRDAGLDVRMVGCGMDNRTDTLVSNAYVVKDDESFIYSLPQRVSDAIRLFDKTGNMEPFDFELAI